MSDITRRGNWIRSPHDRYEISPEHDKDATGQAMQAFFWSIVSQPLNAAKGLWGAGVWFYGTASMIVLVICFLINSTSEKAIKPQSKNMIDNFRPENVGLNSGAATKNSVTAVGNALSNTFGGETTTNTDTLKDKTVSGIR